MDAVADTFRKRDLAQFSTFAGFGRLCRSPMPWLDSERMDEVLLRELQYGTFARLSNIAAKKRIAMDSATLTNLGSCLSETYRSLGYIAANRESTLATA